MRTKPENRYQKNVGDDYEKRTGSDPFNVLVQGIFRTMERITQWSFLTHGYTHITICFMIILALLITDRSYIKVGTLLCMVCGGPIIDFFTKILEPLFTEHMPMGIKLAVLCLGCGILAFLASGFLLGGAVGMGTIICAGFVGPVAGFFMPWSRKIVEKAVSRYTS